MQEPFFLQKALENFACELVNGNKSGEELTETAGRLVEIGQRTDKPLGETVIATVSIQGAQWRSADLALKELLEEALPSAMQLMSEEEFGSIASCIFENHNIRKDDLLWQHLRRVLHALYDLRARMEANYKR